MAGGWRCRCRRSSASSLARPLGRTGAAGSILASASSGRSSPTPTTRSGGWPPRTWAELAAQHRRVARQLPRRTVASRGHRHANAKRAALDRRAPRPSPPGDPHPHHWSGAPRPHRGGRGPRRRRDGARDGRRAFGPSVVQAGIGRVGATLASTCPAAGGRLLVPTAGSRRPSPTTGAAAPWPTSSWVRGVGCPGCGDRVDRNANAALNLRDWTGAVALQSDRDVQRGGVPPRCRWWVTTAGRLVRTRGRARPCKTTARWRGSPTPAPSLQRRKGRNPTQGYQPASAHQRSPNW
jgi:hypothetical protein